MSRISAAIIFIVTMVASVYAQEISQQEGQQQLQLHSFKESKSEGGLPNLFALFKKEDWPTDANGEECALVRVSFENMPMADALKVTYNFGPTVSIGDIQTGDEAAKVKEVWLFVSSATSAIMEAKNDYGMSNRLSNLKLEKFHVYDVVLRNNRTMSITVTTKPEGAMVTMVKTGETKPTPATFTGVPLGDHEISLSLGGRIKRDTIEVTDGNVSFDYDLRKRKPVKFTSDPSNADLYIDGELVGRTPMEVEMPYDSYSVEARLSASEADTLSVTVSDISANEIRLEPIKKKSFRVYAMYQGRNVEADLHIEGKSENRQLSSNLSHTLTLPIGQEFWIYMSSVYGSEGRFIKVEEDMDLEQEFEIEARKSITWPWDREYDASPIGFSIGYVTKQWVVTGEGEQFKANTVWGQGHSTQLRGVQAGFHFQPCLRCGLGLYLGLFYELYMSSNDEYRETDNYDKFIEHSLYAPAHLYFRLPFARKIALSIHGGVGFDYGLVAKLSASNSNIEPLTEYYGGDMWPKRFNMSGEIGASMRFGPVQFNFQYSKGLTDHESYTRNGDYKNVQNKISASISWLFN